MIYIMYIVVDDDDDSLFEHLLLDTRLVYLLHSF